MEEQAPVAEEEASVVMEESQDKWGMKDLMQKAKEVSASTLDKASELTAAAVDAAGKLEVPDSVRKSTGATLAALKEAGRVGADKAAAATASTIAVLSKHAGKAAEHAGKAAETANELAQAGLEKAGKHAGEAAEWVEARAKEVNDVVGEYSAHMDLLKEAAIKAVEATGFSIEAMDEVKQQVRVLFVEPPLLIVET